MPDREHVQTKVFGDTKKSMDQYGEDHEYSDYETVRNLIRSGLVAEGYRSGGDTRLKRVAGEVVRFSASGASVLIGVMLTTPLPLETPTISLLLTALVMTGLWHAEPRVTESINRFRAGRKAGKALTDGGDDGE